MPAEFLAEATALAEAFGIVSLITLVVFLVSLVMTRRLGQKLAWPWRHPRSPWTAWEIAWVFLSFLILPTVCSEFLEVAGWSSRNAVGGKRQVLDVAGEPLAAAGGCVAAAEQLARESTERQLRQIWGMALSIPVIVGLGSYLRRDDRGATRQPTWWPSFAIGALAWLPIAVMTFLVYLICLGVMVLLDESPDSHPFVQLSLQESDWLSWLIFGLLVCVLGPGIEEWLFRGLILRWSIQHSLRPPIVLALAVLFGMLSGNPWAIVWSVTLLIAYPLLRGLATALRPRFPRRIAGGIYASAALFAAGHSLVWPSPVPLFVMGFLLGYLTARTGSITAAWLVHGLFNAITYVYLLRGGATG